MRKLAYIFSLAFVLGCIGSAQSSAQEWAEKMFSELSYDFGVVAKGARPVYTFNITNKYEETIRILGVTTSCGCTTPSLSKNEIASRETIQLNCQFNSDVGQGAKQATIRVRFAEPFVAEVQIAIKGVIRNDVMMQPGQLDFGVFAPGDSPTLTTSITQFGNQNWMIKDVRSLYPHVGVGLVERYRGRDKVIYDLTATIKDTADTERLQGELLLVVNDGRVDSQLTMPFTGKVTSSLNINPSLLTLTDVKAGEEVSRRVILRGDQPFKLVDVTCENLDFVVRADGKAKKVHFLEIVYSAKQAGSFETDITFVTDLNNGSTTTMKALVTVVPATGNDQISLDN